MLPGIVAESDLAGNLQSEYIFFGGERVARRDGPTGAGGVFYYIADHLKTTNIITDAAGNIKNESDYYPWGGELQFLANDSNHYKFSGKERDLETGLDYFGARYYFNTLGRWLTPDWAAKAVAVPYADFSDPQTLNLYGFVENEPLNRIDLDGHDDDGDTLFQQFRSMFKMTVGCCSVGIKGHYKGAKFEVSATKGFENEYGFRHRNQGQKAKVAGIGVHLKIGKGKATCKVCEVGLSYEHKTVTQENGKDVHKEGTEMVLGTKVKETGDAEVSSDKDIGVTAGVIATVGLSLDLEKGNDFLQSLKNFFITPAPPPPPPTPNGPGVVNPEKGAVNTDKPTDTKFGAAKE